MLLRPMYPGMYGLFVRSNDGFGARVKNVVERAATWAGVNVGLSTAAMSSSEGSLTG